MSKTNSLEDPNAVLPKHQNAAAFSIQTTENKEKCEIEMSCCVGSDTFNPAVDRAYLRNRGKFNVPGFRRGKAPRKMVESFYGDGAFWQDAVNELLSDDNVNNTLKAEGYDPIRFPAINITEIDTKGFTFTLNFFVMPEVTIGQYKNLSAPYPSIEVTEDDITEAITAVRERNGRTISTEAPAKDGDTVVMDYIGRVDGKSFEGGSAESHALVLGSNTFIPGFEEGLIGVEAGETRDVSVTFPEDYHAEDLAGKEAVFTCDVQEVTMLVIPEEDDEFAQDVSEFDTIEEYRDSMREKLTEKKESEAENTFLDALVDQIFETMTGETPAILVEERIRDMINDFGYDLQKNGLSPSIYFQLSGSSVEDLETEYRPVAERMVKTGLVLDKIADLEGLTVTDEERDEKLASIAEEYDITVEEAREQVDQESMDNDIKALRASKIILETAVKTEE